MFEVRGVWCGATDLGTSEAEVSAFLDRVQELGFNCILPNLKLGDGRLSWPSERFPECVAPDYREFDLPAVALEQCRARGIECHAWMIDFMEGAHGPAFQNHPEWAARNASGLPTTSETLRGRAFDAVWMCPARRPGYADQWLTPIYEEFAQRYDWDAIHHDYVRYPGDLAPDQYCFCDYCLRELPRWAGYVSEAYPEEAFFHESYDRPYLEAHWEQSPRVLPPNWDRLPRDFQARFLLDGGFFSCGRQDLDYFFYTFRVEAVADFTRMSSTAVRAARPGMRLSAAVFKNPIHSGRFIGQDWRRFAPYVQTAVPMDYRDHFPGSFEQYLNLLAETISRQRLWAAEFSQLWIGVAINFLYAEEEAQRLPFGGDKLQRVIERIESTGVAGIVLFCWDQIDRYDAIAQVQRAFAGCSSTQS